MSTNKANVVLVEKQGEAEIYLLRNSAGMQARITNYGGIVMSLQVPDRQGTFADVVLGYDTVAEYVKASPYFGCLIGRYGNRIAKARFSLDGRTYPLAANNGPNSLHGGVKGFDKVLWTAQPVPSPLGAALELHYLSKHMEEGFPGNLDVVARYTLTDDGSLRIDFTATTDQKTIVNLTHHSYFNLAGRGDILGHTMQLFGERFTPVDADLIPTGELRPVAGSPFDFRKPALIGAHIGDADEQLGRGGGYDHNWIIDKPLGSLGPMVRAVDPSSGRAMEVLSTEPGTQFYSGNFLDGTIVGKGGWRYQKRAAFCIEPGHYPDSPNQPSFPSVALAPGETYRNTIVYRFFVAA
jgi:aldose 1-epimerase